MNSGSTLAERIASLSPEKRALFESRLKQNNFAKIQNHLLIPRRQKQTPAALSFAQERLWFLDQLEPESLFYNMPHGVSVQGALDVEALRDALNTIVSRHEILRTTIESVDGIPFQIIQQDGSPCLSTIDLSGIPELQRHDELQLCLKREINRPFDLTRDLMLRATLLKLDSDQHVLLFVTHHIASDGWSSGVLWQELAALYGAYSRREANPLPDLPIQYADYAEWQRQWLAGEVLQRQLSYWKEQLSELAVLNLATDRPRPAAQTYQGARQFFELSKLLCDQLRVLSRKEGVTLFMTLLAAFQALLHRYSGQDDIAVGSPIAGRTRSETEGLIGFFVNTLVLRGDLSGNPSFREFLRRVRQTALSAYEYQDIPFEKLVEELHPERDLSRSPLFQVLFAFQNIPRRTRELAGLTVTPLENQNETAKFDLSLYILEEKDGLSARLEYNTDLYDGATIGRMLGHYERLLESIVADADGRVCDLAILTEGERHQQLSEWNATERDYARDKSIHQRFEEQVERTPDKIAAEFEDQRLTYRELNSKANQLAHYLRELGVGKRSLVGLCVERSLDMVVGLMGILKAGGAYVPLDAAYPKERLAFMIQDAQAGVLITQQSLLTELPEGHGAQLVCLDTEWAEIAERPDSNPENPTAAAEDLAYVIYTSGSTGKPKGVQITHRAVVNFLNSMQAKPGLKSDDTLLAVTTLSFDIAGLELYLPLSVGARVVIVSREVAVDGELLAEKLKESGATVMQATPTTWRMLLESGWQGSDHLKILCGGEALSPELAAQLLTRCSSLWNMYGPTETTIWSSIHEVRSVNGPIPIGRPIDNTQLYIMDRYQQLLPVGVPGELHIGGAGLARGYLNRSELTEERFVENRFSLEPGKRLYKTGDLARWRPDGEIEILGRLDHQVKIRGFRIELGEIESVIRQHPAVWESVVVTREDTPEDKRIVAYVVLNREGAATVSDLSDFIHPKLPNYMLPSAFVFLEALPLTPNGKVDRNALPAPDGSRLESAERFVAPSTANEKTLALIWAEILRLDKISVHDNFFDLGGHSLLAIRLVSRLRKQFQPDLPIRIVFEAPTVAQLAARLELQDNKRAAASEQPKAVFSHLVELQVRPDRTPIFCFPYRCGVQGEYVHFTRLAQYLGSDYSFYGLQAKAADSVTPPHETVEELAAEYVREITDVDPVGPYYLIGDCAGAPEAYETARQLWGRGKQVGLLVLMDAHGPYWPKHYWRVGSYSIKDLDLVRTQLVSSRPWRLCAYLAEAVSFHLQESKELSIASRLSYLTEKALGRVRTVDPSPLPSEEPELTASEERLLQQITLARRRYRANWPSDCYPGALAVVVNEQWYGFDRSYGWRGTAARGVEVYSIPGDHISYMLAHVPLVADCIRDCLDRARKKASLKICPRSL